ncbi:hypothetical protein [Azospirillum argentinense]
MPPPGRLEPSNRDPRSLRYGRCAVAVPAPGDSGLRKKTRTPAPPCERAQEASEGGRSVANRASNRRIRPIGWFCRPFAQSTSFGFSKRFGISALVDNTEGLSGFFPPPCDIVRSKGVVLPGSK